MNRIILVIGLAVAVAAAIIVVARLGLFHRTTPSPEIMLHPPIYRPAFPAAEPMTPAAVSSLLKHWTYPGAKPVAIKPPAPKAAGATTGPWRVYLDRFTVHGPGRRVPRFYASRLRIDVNAGAGSQGPPFRQDTDNYLHTVMGQVMVRSPEIAESGEFTSNARDYMISAIYAIRPKQRQTLVEVLLVVYAGVQPAAG